MNTKLIKQVFHILYFSSLIGIFVLGYNYTLETLLHKDIFSKDIFEIILVTVVTYFYYYKVFLKDFLKVRKALWLIIIVSLFLIVAINKTIFVHDESLANIATVIAQYIGFSTVLFFALWGLDNVGGLINEKIFATKKALKEAESKLLRQQFNPHFLFNAFNSLYSLSLQNHPKTPDTILKLSGMMRYLTDDLTVSKVKLSRELQFIEDYIAVEKIRFGDIAKIENTISGSVEVLTIEPLLLVTLVENAFKHGFYTNDANAFITLKTTVKDNNLLFKIENSIQNQQHFNSNKREGKGLDNLKKRLQLSYPNKHNLLLQNENNVYLAELKIDLS